jgi:uncharacterized protein (TIGR03118 family)
MSRTAAARRAAFVVPLAVSLLVACGGGGSGPTPASGAAEAVAGATADLHDSAALRRRGVYTRRDLVSDTTDIPAEQHDPNLVNAWGLDALPTSPWWVADNGTGVSTLYNGDGVATPLVVSLPGATGLQAPTGLVANTTGEFAITLGGATGPAAFLFASEDGTVDAWMRTTPIVTQAVTVVPADGAVFKGLAIAKTSAGARLFATDFANGLVRVWDGAFAPVTLAPGAFTDKALPAGFSPFGIRQILGVVVVTYAMRDPATNDDVKGPGLGYVDAYSTSGKLLARLASGGKLNAPWGLALAPPGFGPHALRLLVGNFGDGRILSFGLRRERHHGDDLDDDAVYLEDASGPITVDGLWALSFGNGAVAGPTNALFFTSGPGDEAHGLFGRIDFTPAKRD